MQDLENDAVRIELGAAVIRAMDTWGVARADQCALIGLSRDEWSRVQQSAPLPLQFDVLERVDQLLALAGRYSSEWFQSTMDNGMTPVEWMLRDGLVAMGMLLAAAPEQRESET